jgi:hypothetical protein
MFGATPSFRKGKMKVLISILWLFLVLGVCVGQVNNNSAAKTRPNLSGVWVLDISRSKLTDKAVDYVLTIVHKEPEIKMTKKYRHDNREHLEEVIFYTDGQPEFNSKKGARDPEPVTRWHGNKLVRRSTTAATGIRTQTFPPMQIATTEEWELSFDGKTLTRTITTNGVLTSKVRYVFNRNS